MKKRMLSIFICAVMLISLFPTTAYAAHTNTINAVTILDLEYPVQGKELDTTYNVPESNVHYVKNATDTGVTWYDLGTQGFGTSSGSDIVANESYIDILSQGAKAQFGHYYMAKIELADTGMYDNNAEGGQFTNNVAVTYSYLPSRLKKSDTYTPNQPYTLTVYLFFEADTMYDGYTNWLALSTDKLSSFVEDGDVVKCIIPAGRKPWSLSEFAFSGYEENDFDISVNWYKGTGNNKVEMADSETAVAGQEYTLRVSLNSDKADKNGYFDSGEFNVLWINDVIGERGQVGPAHFQADFVCVAMASVDGITLEGIKAPEAYADMQTTGFSVGEGIEISNVEWNQMSGVQFAIPVTGQFQPNTDYRLMLTLEPKTGYTFNVEKEDIELNYGRVDYYSNSNGIITVGIDFEVGSHTCVFGNEWQKDADKHWKECNCGEKKDVIAHTYNAGVVTTTATCKKAGVKTYTCIVCGNKKTEEYTISHSYGTIWEKDATNHWKVCVCGEKNQVGAHTYDAGVITTTATCQQAGVKTYTCTVCGNKKTEEYTVSHSYGAAWEKDATNHWKACSCGEKKEVAIHTYDAGNVTKEATYTEKGIMIYTCSACGYTKTQEIPVIEKIAAPKGTTITDKATNSTYVVTKSDVTNGTVEFLKPKNKKVTNVKIPDMVTIDGVTYKVTGIKQNAFNGCSKLTSVTIGKNVTKIGDKAFYKCTKLSKITIPSKVNKIGKQAFYGCKKLNTITIKTTKLTSKNVGSKAFTGTPKNAKVKVPEKSWKSYKKFLYKKGLNKKATIKK